MLRVEADGVGFEVAAGAPLALAGPSGAGKTTVLRVIAGLSRPSAGRVQCDDVWLDTERGVDVPPERRGCGLVFQDQALFPHLSAWRNVAYASDRDRAFRLLERFDVAHRAQARPRELSGGERQRVALARAMAARPRVLLLDEPFGALDQRARAHAARELAAFLAELDIPAVVVTHDFEEAALLATEVAVLESRRIVQQDTPSRLAAAPASRFVADFTGAVVLTGTAHPGDLTSIDLDGGGRLTSVDAAEGPVAVSVHPWEISLERVPPDGSALNRLGVEVVAVTAIGNRTRVGLAAPQPMAAEITTASAERLGLRPGARMFAVWKAAATRLSPL